MEINGIQDACLVWFGTSQLDIPPSVLMTTMGIEFSTFCFKHATSYPISYWFHTTTVTCSTGMMFISIVVNGLIILFSKFTMEFWSVFVDINASYCADCIDIVILWYVFIFVNVWMDHKSVQLTDELKTTAYLVKRLTFNCLGNKFIAHFVSFSLDNQVLTSLNITHKKTIRCDLRPINWNFT